jgi:hypothetical protein
VVVVAASVHDNAIGTAVLDKVMARNPGVTKAWVDAGFKDTVAIHGATLGVDVEVVRRDPQTTGFVPEPKRWVVEQTWGTLILHRRLVRDYEARPESSASMIWWSSIDNMTRRVTDTPMPTWRDA